jgi:putative ATP-dependent endonuclease of the OLD family
LLSRRVLLAEGATEAGSMPAVARRLAELDPMQYSSFEALGVCTIDAGTDSQIEDLAKLYRNLGKDVYAVCDKQTAAAQAAIEAQVIKLFMHGESDIEKLVLKNTTQAAMERFIDALQLPPHLVTKYPNPKASAAAVLTEYFNWAKGRWGLADFLTQCTESEVPDWIRMACRDLCQLCQPPKNDDADPDATGDGEPPEDNSDLV